MAETVTVTGTPVKAETYEGKYGEMQVWKVQTAEHGMVELHKKPGNAPPPVGTVLQADVLTREHDGQTVKRLRVQMGQGSTAPPGSGFKRDPKDTARIERLAHHKVAAHLIEHCGTLGLLSPENVKTPEQLVKAVSRLSDLLAADMPGGSV